MEEEFSKDIEIIQSVSEQQKTKLKNDAITFKKLQYECDQTFSSSSDKIFYVLSRKWLDLWKCYVQYQKIINNPNQDINEIGMYKPKLHFNEDLLQYKCNQDQNEFYEWPNTIDPQYYRLNTDLLDAKDYLLVNNEIIQFFKEQFEGLAIPRPSFFEANSKYKTVQVQLQKQQVVFISQRSLCIAHNYLVSKDNEKYQKFIQGKFMQIFTHDTLTDVKSQICSLYNSLVWKGNLDKSKINISKSVQNILITRSLLRLWKLNQQENKDIWKKLNGLFEQVLNQKEFSYQLDKKDLLLKVNEEKLNSKFLELNVKPEDVIIAEICDSYASDWVLDYDVIHSTQSENSQPKQQIQNQQSQINPKKQSNQKGNQEKSEKSKKISSNKDDNRNYIEENENYDNADEEQRKNMNEHTDDDNNDDENQDDDDDDDDDSHGHKPKVRYNQQQDLGSLKHAFGNRQQRNHNAESGKRHGRDGLGYDGFGESSRHKVRHGQMNYAEEQYLNNKNKHESLFDKDPNEMDENDIEVQRELLRKYEGQNQKKNEIEEEKNNQESKISKLGFKCENCLKFCEEGKGAYCKCKKAKYCSNECMRKDAPAHLTYCDYEEKSDDSLTSIPYKITLTSRKGQCGLNNLGNTCFMNSCLQCLSHTELLSLYFLSKKYKSEINLDNPLGSKGVISKQYAGLIKHLWCNQSDVYSPNSFKKCVGQINQMYQGYQQHDSQEFLCFLLNEIHEDLNRIKKKPYTEEFPNQSLESEQFALQSWIRYCKRNQSIVTDLFFGQFRSIVTCQTCLFRSVTFDPFLVISLPIPDFKMKQITIYILFSDNRSLPQQLFYQFYKKSGTKIADIKKYVFDKYHIEIERQSIQVLSKLKVIQTFSDDDTVYQLYRAMKPKQQKISFNCFILEIPTDYLQILFENRFELSLYTSKNLGNLPLTGSQVHERNITFVRKIWVSRMDTLQKIHHKIFSYLRFLFEENEKEEYQKNKILQENDYELYLEKIQKFQLEDRPYVVNLVSVSNLEGNCIYCSRKKCTNCQLPESAEVKLDDYLKKIEQLNSVIKQQVSVAQSSQVSFEVEVYFKDKKDFYSGDELKNRFYKISNKQEKNVINQALQKEISLQNCLDLFHTKELLEKDNQWYCSQCKGHRDSVKQLQMQRVPEILIIHLKRFKTKHGQPTSKNNQLVKFPIKDLDLTMFVQNKLPPSQYFQHNDQQQQNVYVKPNFLQEKMEKLKEKKQNDVKQEKDNLQGQDLQQKEKGQQQIQQGEKMVQELGSMKHENQNSKDENYRKIDEFYAQKEYNLDLNQKVLFDLYAVSNHSGDLNGGHYTAYCQNTNSNDWSCFNDSSVSEIQEDRICQPENYLLFYKRKYYI